MFKSMKIEIKEQQPLKDVVRELERLGYKYAPSLDWCGSNYIGAWDDGTYCLYHNYNAILINGDCITLAELRSMNVGTLKEM